MTGKINHMLTNCQSIPMHANNRTVEIEVENKKYEGCFTCKGDPLQTSYGIILTHGAGGDMNNKQLVNIAEKLAGTGYLVLRFTCKGLNLGYRTKVFKGILLVNTSNQLPEYCCCLEMLVKQVQEHALTYNPAECYSTVSNDILVHELMLF